MKCAAWQSNRGNTLSEAERDANANSVHEAIRNLIELGNSKFRDQYIFGGFNVNKAPLEIVGDAVRFSGNGQPAQYTDRPRLDARANVTADETFWNALQSHLRQCRSQP